MVMPVAAASRNSAMKSANSAKAAWPNVLMRRQVTFVRMRVVIVALAEVRRQATTLARERGHTCTGRLPC